jgi:hypothetical protein
MSELVGVKSFLISEKFRAKAMNRFNRKATMMVHMLPEAEKEEINLKVGSMYPLILKSGIVGWRKAPSQRNTARTTRSPYWIR